ncbi:C39 family peptidase [Melittangium boletus]|uniref:C39 family peptidase n=1 Tax=Melittangium boletus TaxID=83453 RepID=UPI003DA29962
MPNNDVLFRLNTMGASAKTAAQDDLSAGVSASQQMAKTDLVRLKKYATEFLSAGTKHGLPPALLAAIASRETRGGARLDSEGYGSNGADFGLMQVNEDSHTLQGGPFSFAHIDQATGILKQFQQAVKKKHPLWSPEQQLRGAVAAYNFGVSNVKSWDQLDVGSANDDYSSDIWARARWLAPHFGGGVNRTAESSAEQGRPAGVAQRAGADGLVHELQALLVKYGFMSAEQVATGPGVLGPRTREAVARVLAEKGQGTPVRAPTSRPPALASKGAPSAGSPVKPVWVLEGVPLFRQGDAAWGQRILGKDRTIHGAGCAMTSVAMAISKISGQAINPGELDEYLDSHAGYSVSSSGVQGNGLKWNVAAKSRGLSASRWSSCQLSMIDKELSAGRPVVAGVDYKAGSDGGANGTDHWVTIVGKSQKGAESLYSAHDPATGAAFTFKAQGNQLVALDAINKYKTTGEVCTFTSFTAAAA